MHGGLWIFQPAREFNKVELALAHIDFIMSMFLPSDAPAAAEVLQMGTMLKYSTKPICFVTYEFEGLQEIIEMLETAMGGKDQLRINPTHLVPQSHHSI